MSWAEAPRACIIYVKSSILRSHTIFIVTLNTSGELYRRIQTLHTPIVYGRHYRNLSIFCIQMAVLIYTMCWVGIVSLISGATPYVVSISNRAPKLPTSFLSDTSRCAITNSLIFERCHFSSCLHNKSFKCNGPGMNEMWYMRVCRYKSPEFLHTFLVWKLIAAAFHVWRLHCFSFSRPRKKPKYVHSRIGNFPCGIN